MPSERGVGAGSLGAVLDERRLERFVGRTSEVELFAAALEAAESTFAVLHVHGAGGIGKSWLLDAFAVRAASPQLRVIRLDGRSVMPTPTGVTTAVEEQLESLGVDHTADGDPDAIGGRLVVLVDSYEQLADVDDWFRTTFVPGLPATALVVLAGRDPPRPEWRFDPAWDDLLRVVSIGEFDPDECLRYLRLRGVTPPVADRLASASHGYPLALSLMCDVVAHGGELGGDPLSPDVVEALVARFVDVVEDPVGRRALEACAIARTTTESLLRRCSGGDAGRAFAWLRELSFIEAVPDGLVPHDLARDVLDRDARWRDPESYRNAYRCVRDHVCQELESTQGRARLRAIFDLKFLFRNMAGLLSPVDWSEWGRHYPEPARAADRDQVVGLIAANEGERSAELAAGWWDSQPDGFFVIRDEPGIRGVVVLLDLTAASDADRARDPGALSAWTHAHRHAAPRTGEVVSMTRFVQDRDAGQGPSPTLNAVPIVTLQRYLNLPNLAIDYLALIEPEPWDDYFRTADLLRVDDADFTVDGRRSGLFFHDFRRLPVGELIRLWTERSLEQDPLLQTDASADAIGVLSEEEFRAAVRSALRVFHASDRLAASPLAQTRLVGRRAGADGVAAGEALHRLLSDAIEALRSDPRDERRLRAVERTFVHAAPTQEAAAEVLGLPFSTYRRHLTQGVDRIAGWLWDHELAGTTPERQSPT